MVYPYLQIWKPNWMGLILLEQNSILISWLCFMCSYQFLLYIHFTTSNALRLRFIYSQKPTSYHRFMHSFYYQRTMVLYHPIKGAISWYRNHPEELVTASALFLPCKAKKEVLNRRSTGQIIFNSSHSPTPSHKNKSAHYIPLIEYATL